MRLSGGSHGLLGWWWWSDPLGPPLYITQWWRGISNTHQRCDAPWLCRSSPALTMEAHLLSSSISFKPPPPPPSIRLMHTAMHHCHILLFTVRHKQIKSHRDRENVSNVGWRKHYSSYYHVFIFIFKKMCISRHIIIIIIITSTSVTGGRRGLLPGRGCSLSE